MKKIRIITGSINSGKTTALRRRVEALKQEGRYVEGFITEAESVEGIKQAYYLRRIGASERVLLAEKKKSDGEGRKERGGEDRLLRTPGYIFHTESFAEAARWLGDGVSQGAEVICIDELGPVELRGGGHQPALDSLTNTFHGELYLVIRKELLCKFLPRLEQYRGEIEIEEVKKRGD